MIIIDGRQITPQELSVSFPSRGIETECVYIMHNSNAKYYFDSFGELDFEISMRREIVSHAGKLLRSGLEFEVFRKSYCNTRYWIRSPDGGFDLKKGASPSTAIRDIYNNGKAYATECATAMQIVYHGALLSMLGDTSYDRIFSSGISLMNWHKLSNALRETGLMRPIDDALPGDRRYFNNPDVNLLAPEWQGENVIDMGDGTYYGHGLGRVSGEYIISELNKNRKHNATRSAYLLPTAGRPNFSRIYNSYVVTSYNMQRNPAFLRK